MSSNLRACGCLIFAAFVASVGAQSTSVVADAVMRGDAAAAARALLAKKADVNAPQADGATALHWAVYRDDPAVVELLLKAGADAKAANSFGATPLSLAAERATPRSQGVCSTPVWMSTNGCSIRTRH